MANFKVNDWVEITSNSDLQWDEWTEIHDAFTGAIGQIKEIDFNGKLRIVVDFKEPKYKEGVNHYWLWFLDRHVILSSKEKAKTRQQLRKAGSDLQNYEATVRKNVDNNLKYIFGIKNQTVPEKVELWSDEDTDEIPTLPELDKVSDDLDDWFDQYGP